MTTETEITEDLEGAIADLKAVLDYADEMRSVEERQRRLLAHAAMTTVERVQSNLDALHGEFWSIHGGQEHAPELDSADPLDDLSAAMLLLSEARDVLDVLDEHVESGAAGAMIRDARRRVHDALAALDRQEQRS